MRLFFVSKIYFVSHKSSFNLVPISNLIFIFPDIKVVLDLVPNHTSNESVWFQEALKGNKKYIDYFVWEDGVIDENGNRQPPNNWVTTVV